MLLFYIPIIAWLLIYVVQGVQTLQSKVPGPWYTNFTTVVLKYFEFTRRRRSWIHQLHKQYGPVVRLAPNEVSFSNFDGMREIYQSGGSGYDKTPFYDLFTQFKHRTLFTMLDKKEHAQRRRMFADRYSMTNILRSNIVEGIKQRAASVIGKCEASKGTYLDVYVTLHCYALDCASHFLFSPGGSRSLVDPEDFKLMRELSYHDSLQQRLIAHYWPWLDKINSIFKPKSTMLAQKFVLDRANKSHPDKESLMGKLKEEDCGLQTIQMAAETLDHMSAGIDTTGDGLCFLMHELSLPRSRVHQERLQQEIRENLHTQVDQLPYLDAIVKEGLRLFPPIPMSLPRFVPQGGRNICGYDITGGSIVSCQAYSLHLLNEDVYPRPESFIPERWLEKEGSSDRNRLFFPFGSGGRGCIAKHLAVIEMKILLRGVYARYTTTVASEMKGDMSIDDQMIASRPKDQTCLLVFEDQQDGIKS